ncbi:MAG: tyrosine-type recombinase/integrase [Candidatus Buchananbacteria bacterium]|nr:tyrosine-type recombinase/integrase [Candidatus Buchananbacteria bacterium]
MQKSNKTIISLISDFLEYCEVEKGLSPVSTRNYHNFLKVFIKWLKNNDLSDLMPHEFSTDHIWNYRLYLSRKHDKDDYIKKTTQSYYLIAVRNLLNYFAEKDITSLPAEKIKLPKLTDKDKKIKFLKFEQVEKLFNMPDVSKPDGLRDRAILEILFSTGMRVSELTSLNINLFDRVNLLNSKSNDLELSINGKGGSTRTVYFSNRSLKWLAKYLKTRNDLLPPLFINYQRNQNDEHRLSPRSIETLVKKYSVMAALPVDTTPHTLRHSYATDLLDRGADLRSVQELLGHKNIVTTQIYTHVTNKKLREIHRQFHSGEKK